MSTDAALLRTIRETPEDDTARLVYADFVEEEGDPARGEFIRVQVALANTSENDAARRTLEDREQELLAEGECRWLGVAPESDGLVGWAFSRGFVDEVSATPSFMLNEGRDLCAAHPLRRWRVQSSQQDMITDLTEAGGRGWFSRLEALDMSGWFSTIGELERFFTRSDFSRLRELDLTHRPGLDDLAGILEHAISLSPLREQLKILRCGGRYPGEAGRLDAWDLTRALTPSRLTELSVPGCLLTAQDVRGLLVGECCRELTSLNIRDNQIEPDGWDAFRGVRCRLRELDLSGTPLGAISLEEVLGQDSLSELRVLNLNRCGSAMANIRALAGSKFWTQAEELRMQAGTIPENSLDPLFASAGSPCLRTLDVSQNYFRDAGVNGLCNAKWADSLTWLSLSQNYITDESLRMIAACPRFGKLRTLHLGNNNQYLDGANPDDRITDAGLRALAGSTTLVNLRNLDLSGIEFSAAGIDAVINDERRQLRSLMLSGCHCSPDVIRVLAGSPALSKLRRLDLSYNYDFLRGDALKPLAESENLSPHCELDIRECHADEDTLAALRDRLGHRLRHGTGGHLEDFDF